MSYLNQDLQEETCHEAATLVYDSLLRDIERAQAELSSINTALANTGVHQATNMVAASVLKNEVDELKQTKVEGLAEDPQMRYYLAVGKLEKQIEEMRQAKEMMGQRKAARASRRAELDAQISEQREAITKMEAELEASGQGEGGADGANKAARKEINAKIRLNKILLSEMKGGLKKFIDLTAELQDGNSTKEGSPYGFLIQALWGNYLKNGVSEYISIQAQDFDVPSSVLSHLVHAGIVKIHPSDNDKVRMEDFTCSD